MKYSKMLGMIQQVLSKDDGRIDFALTAKMANRIELWSSMYEGRAPWLSDIIQDAELSPAIASETARLITLELQSDITGGARADYLAIPYKTLLGSLRRYVEYGCAKGGLIIKPYVSSSGIEIQYVQADSFFPIDFDNSGNILRCVFLDQFRKGDKIYSRLEVHLLENGSVTITNRAFLATNDSTLGNEISLEAVEKWSELAPAATLPSERQMFGYFKVPLANADDSDSPLGVSTYSRAVGLTQEADRRHSQINWEYSAKEAAIHANSSLLKRNQETQKPELPKGKERLYREVEYNTGATDKPFFETFSPDIRDESLYNGFNNLLRRIEFNCCLAYGTLSDPQNIDKTATEVKASKQRSYTYVSDCQMALQRALEDAVYAMDYYCSLYHLAPAGPYEISFKWDDSIIIDAEQEREQDRKDVAMGVMKLEEYRAKWYGETLEEAAKNLPEPALTEE